MILPLHLTHTCFPIPSRFMPCNFKVLLQDLLETWLKLLHLTWIWLHWLNFVQQYRSYMYFIARHFQHLETLQYLFINIGPQFRKLGLEFNMNLIWFYSGLKMQYGNITMWLILTQGMSELGWMGVCDMNNKCTDKILLRDIKVYKMFILCILCENLFVVMSWL